MLKGIEFRGKMVVTKEQIADFFEVSSRTIDNYLAQNEIELKNNGYEILRGKSLQKLKLTLKEMCVDETYFVDIKKAPSLGVFDIGSILALTDMRKSLNLSDTDDRNTVPVMSYGCLREWRVEWLRKLCK